jgi:hypothetical protein
MRSAAPNFHKRKLRHRVAGVLGLISKGQNLRHHAPRGTPQPQAVNLWIEAVQEWINETTAFLGKYSMQAAVAFCSGVRHDAEYPGVAGKANER